MRNKVILLAVLFFLGVRVQPGPQISMTFLAAIYLWNSRKSKGLCRRRKPF